jgi:hypothetical protein
MLKRLDDTSLVSADIESISSSDFLVLQDAVLDVFGNEHVPPTRYREFGRAPTVIPAQ